VTAIALDPLPINTPFDVNVETPVPPCATAKSVVSVNEEALNAPETSSAPFKSTLSFNTILFDPSASSVKSPDTL